MEGSTASWFRTLLWLTKAEFSRIVRAPAGLHFLLGTIGFLGLFYWFLSTWRLAYFLDLTYITLPVFFLAIGSTLISRERETGFARILFTHPVDGKQHYLANLLSLGLLAGTYLLVLVPFDILIVHFGGAGWLSRILVRAGWTLLTTFFVGSLALFISAALGRRATLPSVSIGFVLAMFLVWTPFLVFQYLGFFDPSVVPIILALLHVSPTMGGMDLFQSHGLVLSQPLLPVLVLVLLSVFMAATGLLVYTRLQSPEGWEAPRKIRVVIPLLVLVVLVALPVAAPFVYDPPPSMSGSNSATFGSILFYLSGLRPTAPTQQPMGFAAHVDVGTTLDAQMNISADNTGSTTVTLDRLELRWGSEYFEFNVTRANLGPVRVPPVSSNQSLTVTIPLRVTALFAPSLGSALFPGTFTPVLIELIAEAQGAVFTFRYADNYSLQARGPDYNRDIAWLLVVAMALATVGLRALGRAWRRKG